MGTARRGRIAWFPTTAVSGPASRRTLALLALTVTVLTAGHAPRAAVDTATGANESVEPIVPIPSDGGGDPRHVALGERLFHDVRLSRNRLRSCATCHPLDRGGTDDRTRPFTSDGQLHGRNTPTVFNVGLSAFFNWDGVASTLEAHAETVLRRPSLMNITWPELLRRLGADAGYVARFRAAYPGGLTRSSVLDALAAFERTLVTPDSRFDQYLRGERDALTASECRGYALFKDYGCVSCHHGVNIGGHSLQKFGVCPDASVQEPVLDLGRYYVTGMDQDRGVFRVPSLRGSWSSCRP